MQGPTLLPEAVSRGRERYACPNVTLIGCLRHNRMEFEEELKSEIECVFACGRIVTASTHDVEICDLPGTRCLRMTMRERPRW